LPCSMMRNSTLGRWRGVELGRRERTISKPSNRMGAFDEIRNRSASACHALRVGRFGSDPKRTAAAAGGIAAANINRQRLHTRLRLVRYVLPEYVCAARHCYVAGQSTMLDPARPGPRRTYQPVAPWSQALTRLKATRSHAANMLCRQVDPAAAGRALAAARKADH
jgi:hypothetical protein